MMTMDPIQQRLQAVYQKKSESDIDRKLKSVSTTVLDQRIAFHDASKVPSCPNSQLKGKYLFMKPTTSIQSVTPTPKKVSESRNNNAVNNPVSQQDYHPLRERTIDPVLTAESRQEETSSHAFRNGSELLRNSRSRSPVSSNARGRSQQRRKSRSRSPLLRKSRSRSQHRSESGSSEHTRKSWIKSPLPRPNKSRSPPSRKSRSRSPLSRSNRSRSPHSRKSRSRSQHRRKSDSRSPPPKMTRSRSPVSRKTRSRSPLLRKSRSKTLLSSVSDGEAEEANNISLLRKDNSSSPTGKASSRSPSRGRSDYSRKSKSKMPFSEYYKSRSPLLRAPKSLSPSSEKSNKEEPVVFRSNSPFAKKSRSRSPLARKLTNEEAGKPISKNPQLGETQSRSPKSTKSKSRSPQQRKSRNRSPCSCESKNRFSMSRKSRSRSPLSREPAADNLEKPKQAKATTKKHKKKFYKTPFWIVNTEDSDSEPEVANLVSMKPPCEGEPGPRIDSTKPGTGRASDYSSDEDAAPKRKNHKKSAIIKPSDGSPRFLQRDRRLGRSPPKVKEKSCKPYVEKSPEKKVPKIKIRVETAMNIQKVEMPPSWRIVPSAKQKIPVNEVKPILVKADKTKEKPRQITPSSSDNEPEVIRKYGTSTRPIANTSVEKNEPGISTSDEDSSDKEQETFDWVDFKVYLPDNFDNISYYPPDDEVLRMAQNLPRAVTQGEDGDNMPRPNTILFPEHRLDYSWRFPDGGCGLVNRGNTCFVNAALQCLTYCPPFVNYLLSGQHTRECRMMQKDKCILCSFTRYLQESLRVNKHNIVPIWFLNNLYSIAKHFSLGRQEDSHEYLRLSLEQMQKVCLVGHNQLDKFSKETTVVNQIFGGFLRSQVVCLKCKAKSNTFDPFLDISLDIRTCNTLERAFEMFVSPERLDIENAYKCGKCKQKVEALKRFTIHKAPNIMTIQLKRFQATHDDKFGGTFRGVKLNKAVKFPPRLNIRGYMSIRNGPPELYSLYALLFHEGHSANSGHYTCTVKSGNKWFHISDGTKIRTSLHTVSLQDVYVLFYMREDKQQNMIIQNPALKTQEQKAKEVKAAQRQPSFTSTPSTSGIQKPSTSGTPNSSHPGGHKFIGPVRPKIIHTNEPQFKPVKASTNSGGTPGIDIGTPVKRKDNNVTPQKQHTPKAPLATDRNKVSFGIKTPAKVHPSANSNDNAPERSNSHMTKFHSEPALASAKPRIVMQIKNGKATTIEKSPDGQKKILSDDEEVVAKMNEKKSHKKHRKSLLVPYGNESSSDSDTEVSKDMKPKFKKERQEDGNTVVFDTRLNATTSVPGNIHLMKSVSSHLDAGSEPSKSRDKQESTKTTGMGDSSKSTNSAQDEKPTKVVYSVQEEKTAKTDNVSDNSHANFNGNHVYMKHPNGSIHIYDSEPKDNKAEDKPHHGHTAGKKRKLIEDAKIDIVNGEFHVVSDKKPLLSPVENGHSEKAYQDTEEYHLLKKAKKHKKHKKDKHRHKEHRYEALVNESDHGHHSEHHVKKHKKKKRKHKERDYDIEEEHSYKKRKFEVPHEAKTHRHHHFEKTEETVHKRHRQESESSSSAEFEWVEKKIDTPVRLSKSTSW